MPRLSWLWEHREAFSDDVRLTLVKTIIGRTASMIFAAVNVMLLAGVSAARLPGSVWPWAWLVLEVLFLIGRLALIRAATLALQRRDFRPFTGYIGAAIAWCALVGLGACACVASGDTVLAALAAINICGIAAGISSRSAAFPRLAICQILLVGIPYAIGAAISHLPGLFILAIETPLCFAAMSSLALTHYSDIVNLIRAERENWFLAYHDTLTGLPNRKQLNDRLEQICTELDRSGDSPMIAFAVLCLDLDGFKNVNDTFGHPAGDALLKAVADRLKLAVRATDIVGRTGGDEFVVLLPGADQLEAAVISARIIAAIGRPFQLGLRQRLHVGTTIGGAFAPLNGAFGDILLARADQALYFAKRAGRGVYRTYSDSQTAISAERR